MAYPSFQQTDVNSELFANLVAQAQYAVYENSIARQMVTVFDAPLNAGKVIQVPVWSSMSAVLIEDEATSTLAQTETTSTLITLGEHVVYRKVSDMLRDSSYSNVLADMGNQAGLAIAESMDAQVFGKFSGFSSDLGSTSTELTVDLLLKAAATLRANKLTGPFMAVVHPGQAYNLKKQLTYSAQTNIPNLSGVGEGVLSSFYIGGVAGIQIYESALVSSVTTGGATAYRAGVFAMSALGHAMRGGIDMETQRQAKDRATDMVLKAVAGAGVLQASHGVAITAEGTLN